MGHFGYELECKNVKSEVDETDSEMCPRACFIISDVEQSSYITRELVN